MKLPKVQLLRFIFCLITTAVVVIGICVGVHTWRQVALQRVYSQIIMRADVDTSSASRPSRPNSDISGGKKKYMFALRITEQLTMSSIHFQQFLNLVNDWNFTGVEPFVYRNTIFGLRSVTNTNNHDTGEVSVNFGTLFNVSQHNSYLSKCMKRKPDPNTGSHILFEPVVKFLRYSYRKFVVVYFSSYWNVLPSGMWKSGLDQSIRASPDAIQECSDAAKRSGLFSEVEGLLHKEVELERSQNPDSLPRNLESFQGVQAFCVKTDVVISLRDLRDFILNQTHKQAEKDLEVSIIFIVWQGRFTTPLVESDVKDYINNCRLPFSQQLHSDKVIKMSNDFIESLGFAELPYLSVHIRFEKVYLYAQSKRYPIKEYVNCCVRRLNYLLKEVRQKHNLPTNRTLLIWDYSPHGSYTCPLKDCKTETDVYLTQIDATPSFFDSVGYDLTRNSGLISVIESEGLYKGKVLVTMGGGSYQETVTRTFIERHRDTENPFYGHLCIPKEKLNDIVLPTDPECSFDFN